MRLSTFNSINGRINLTLLFIAIIASFIPTSSSAEKGYSSYTLNMDDFTLEETSFFTPDDSYTSITFINGTCLDNATTPTDGQFKTTLEIKGLSGKAWFVDDAIGFYDMASPAPPAPPIPLMEGPGATMFTEVEIVGTDSSYYTLDVITVHKESNQIRLRNNINEIVNIIGQSDHYDHLTISGPISLCSDLTESVVYEADTDLPISWEVIGNGSIVGSDKNNPVEVLWDGTPGEYQLIGTVGSNCVAPTIQDIVVGEVSGGSMLCEMFINLSLAGLCERKVEPSDLVLGDPQNGVPYAVMILDENDEVIPNATLNHSHVGQTVKAKLLDGCGSNNSCWTMITVEDKMPPQIVCEDVTISCDRVDEYEGPFALDNCSKQVEVIMTSEEINQLTCDDNYGWEIYRTYIAIDEHNNVSQECPQTIYVERVELDSIKFPANLTKVDMTALSCDVDYKMTEEGYPHPDVTGIPTLGGEYVWPKADKWCNIVVSYKDRYVDLAGCTDKVMREWKIYEWWCDQVVDTAFTQTIEITDYDPPVITSCPEDVTVSASTGECEANVFIPGILAEDECKPGTEKIDVVTPYESFLDFDGSEIVRLPMGMHEIKYYVYDECLNSDSCSYIVTVQDKTPPTVVCDQNTVVGLDINGYAYAPASTFDDGSKDACGIDYMEVRRMDLGAPCTDEVQDWAPYIEFCCADAGQMIVVELRVWDLAGLSNTCMVNVEVQDKFSPSLQAPDDRTIECDEDYDLNDLSEYGEAVVEDACGATLTEDAYDEVDQCRTGVIVRAFRASDSNGFAVDTQRIYIINSNPFNEDGMAIDWPEDYETTAACGEGDTDPDNLPIGMQRPRFDEGICDLVSSTYKDEIYPFDDPDGNACYKVIRKWYVIDWCQPIEEDRIIMQPLDDWDGEPDPRFATWIFDQTLKIRNIVPPVIAGPLTEVDTCSVDCDGGMITLMQSATDDCTPALELRWTIDIDLDDDGSIDSTASGNGSSVDASGMYPIGRHSILWTFLDRCGNKITEKQLFTVRDCNGPKLIAIDGFSVGLTPMDLDNDNEPDDEMACINADSLGAKAIHPCNVPVNLSFSADTTDDEICFNCFDLGLNEITLWVTDIFGNIDTVTFHVDVQDNNDVDICADPRDCVVFPEDLEITDCVIDLDPVFLNSEPFIDPDCVCDDYDVTFKDDTLNSYPDANCLFVRRTWRVQFNCGRNPIITAEDQEIRIFNVLDPDLTVPADVSAETVGEECTADISLAAATSTSPCNTGVIITNSYNDGGPDASDSYPVGTTLVVFTAMDACGNSTQDTTTVMVTDGGDPICVPQDITVTLDGDGNATITADQVDGGSTDSCGVIDTIILDKYSFDCSELGDNDVTLTVTDDSGNTSECTAVVTVIDTLAPMCMTNDITITVDASGPTVITPDTIDGGSSDPCGSIATLELDRTSFTCEDLADSPITVTLTVTDDGGNTSSCTAQVTLEDNDAPICEAKDITISVNDNVPTVITPEMVDNGSSDGCGEVAELSLDRTSFDCSDLDNSPVVVTLTVTDDSGNTSNCTANVFLEDNAVLECVANDYTVYLDDQGVANIIPEDIDGGSSAGCNVQLEYSLDISSFSCASVGGNGVVVTLTVSDGQDMSQCTATVTVLDTFPPSISCSPLTLTCSEDIINLTEQELLDSIRTVGMPVVNDNCPGVTVSDAIISQTLNECNIGVIVRRIYAEDASGNIDSCVQTIDIEGEDNPFDEMNIDYPEDITIQCEDSTLPGNTGETIISDQGFACTKINVSYTDEMLEGMCVDTIRRTWIVVDSCQFNGTNPAPGTFDSHVQTIVIEDNIGPEIIVPNDMTVTNATGAADCAVFVDLSGVMVNDNCSGVASVTNNTDNNPDTGDASGEFVPGEYTIVITATDSCGNMSQDSFNLFVDVPENPGLPCIKVFASIRDNGMVTVTPSSFGVTQGNECYDPSNLTFSFDLDMTITSITYDCDQLGDHDVTLYAFEDGVLFDSCVTLVTVIDPNNNCLFNVVGVEGNLFTAFGEDIEGVEVSISGDINDNRMTDANGTYAFASLPRGLNINVQPYKNNDIMNGVSTLDLIKIQRHILGIEELENEYLLVAADINRSKKISTIDLLDLRKVILGINDEFPNNTSWRMIGSDYTFPERMNPFVEQLPDQYQIESLDSRMDVDFVGVKVGDVDGSAQANSRSGITSRNNASITLERSVQGDKVVYSLIEDLPLEGFQVAGDVKDISLVEVNSGLEGFGSDNFHIDEEGILRISFNLVDKSLIEKGTVLFEISALNNYSEMTFDASYSEIYMNNGNSIDAYKIDVKDIMPTNLTIVSNNPNPWSEFTNIVYELSYEDDVQINMYGTNGKLIYIKEVKANIGHNEVRIYRDDIDASGIIFYDIITSKEKVQGKMILIK